MLFSSSPRRARLAALACAAVVAGLSGAALAVPASAAGPAASDYIVVLHDDVARASDVADQHRHEHGALLSATYEHALKGYAARLSARAVAGVRRDPRVAYVELDGMAYPASTTQEPPTWGLDRVDQRDLPLDLSYVPTADGAGVTVYVIDSGIRSSHQEFGGRVAAGHSFVDDGRGTEDCSGHGTHVAGTIGGSTHGVAKAVTLVPVRVFPCSGGSSWSVVTSAVDWVTQQKKAAPAVPAVANMSLSGGANSTHDRAVRRSISTGVTYAVAAGNRQGDACNYSPARVGEAATVSATDSTDTKAWFANDGSCVNIFAPGLDVRSAWWDTDSAFNTISGTSMAAPHVAGAAALHLQADPGASPSVVLKALYDASTRGIVTGAVSPNNHLLFTGTDPANGDGGGTTEPAPKPKGKSGK